MKYLFYTIIFFIVFLTQQTTATASPSLNANCAYAVSTPRNGMGVIFNDSCEVAYVLPPKNGSAEVVNLARTTNLQFCPAIKNIGQVASKTVNSMVFIADKIEKMIQDFDPLDKELIELRIKVAESKSQRDNAHSILEEAQTHWKELKMACVKRKEPLKNVLKII